MYLHGEFLNKKGNIVKVEILTHNDRSKELVIGDNKSRVWFTDDPVEIESQINDTFDVLLTHSAVIRLESGIALTDLYCSSCMDAVVNIYLDGKCIFAGFIEPQAYSQPFCDSTDEVEINCIDALSALQYGQYAGVGGGSDYTLLRQGATSKTFGTLIKEILDTTASSLDISGTHPYSIHYDVSKRLKSASNPTGVFDSIAISELLLLGEDEDSVWTRQEVMEEILKYLGLHIEQEGFNFYIFSWQTAKGKGKPAWLPLKGEGVSDLWADKSVKEINVYNSADTDTTINIGETYNLISLSCEVSEADILFESPLSEDAMTSPYLKRQKYLTTCSTVSALQFIGFCFGVNNGTTEEGDSTKDWYLRVKNHPYWKFYGDITNIDLYKTYCAEGAKVQEGLPNFLGTPSTLIPFFPGEFLTPVGAALLSWGSVELARDPDDNSLVSSIDMKDYLVVSVGGNKNNTTPYPTEGVLQNSAPVASYIGPSSGAMLSPSDDTTTNYIVFSGSLTLSPVTDVSCFWRHRPGTSGPDANRVKGKDDKERYYIRKYWKTNTPCGPEIEDATRDYGLCPPDEDGPALYEFKNSAVGVSSDFISKVSVLACMLIIGDKCLVETGTHGKVTDFEWRPYKPMSECANVDEYFAQTFTIGMDPKKGDFLLGTEFPIQNNISYDLGLETEGMAIPIKKSDNIHGPITFHILGPINVYWDEVTCRHATFFRSEKWSVNSVPLMAHVQNIYIKDFEAKLYSDNSLNDNLEDCDLIYMSDTDENYINKKDDLNFKFVSALTAEERVSLGIKDSLNLSTPINLEDNGNGLLTIFDEKSKTDAKPEQIYVDEAWTEWHNPRIQISQNLTDLGDIRRFDIYKHPALPGKQFFIQGISRNLKESEANVNLKEIEDD